MKKLVLKKLAVHGQGHTVTLEVRVTRVCLKVTVMAARAGVPGWEDMSRLLGRCTTNSPTVQ